MRSHKIGKKAHKGIYEIKAHLAAVLQMTRRIAARIERTKALFHGTRVF